MENSTCPIRHYMYLHVPLWNLFFNSPAVNTTFIVQGRAKGSFARAIFMSQFLFARVEEKKWHGNRT